jgi:hypothetical protein
VGRKHLDISVGGIRFSKINFSTIWQISSSDKRLSFAYEKNETHVSSIMTLLNARTRDTGYYECYLPLFGELRVKQYLYVYSESVDFNRVGIVFIPCIDREEGSRLQGRQSRAVFIRKGRRCCRALQADTPRRRHVAEKNHSVGRRNSGATGIK